ncbi:MAG TPA: DUF308 domain-containing protein [Gaiellaceae bacterium]|nr:DUF308 domain-containing protein [Gaiellaceae bacterium]
MSVTRRRGKSARPRRPDAHRPAAGAAASIYALAAFFLILGVGSIVVGAHDAALTQPTLGETAASALLIVGGILLVVAAANLDHLVRRTAWRYHRRPPCHPTVLVACLVALLFGVYVLFSGLGSPARQRWVVVAVALVIIGAAAFGLVLFGRDVELTLPRVGAAVALALLGTTVGAYEFWYQNQYIPAHAGGAVSLKVNLTRAGQEGPFDVIRATLDYEEIGGKSVAAVGSAYSLTGSRIVRCPRAATVQQVKGAFQGFLLDPQRIRFMADVLEQPPNVLAAGRFVADGKRLDPNVPANREFVFLVPRHRYQLLRFRAQLFAVPASVPLSRRLPPIYTAFPGDNELYGYWRIDDDSWLHDLLTGRDRWLVLRYDLVDPGNTARRREPAQAALVSQALHVVARFPRPTWREGLPSQQTTQRMFDQPQTINTLELGDASEPFADSELPLERPVETCERLRR